MGRMRASGRKAPLFQLWVTERWRIFVRAASAVAGVSASEYVRAAVWEHVLRTLSDAQFRECEQRAAQSAAKETKPNERKERDV